MTAKKPPTHGPMYEPSPETIAAETALIRAEWSPDKRRARAGCGGKYARNEAISFWMGKFAEIEVGK